MMEARRAYSGEVTARLFHFPIFFKHQMFDRLDQQGDEDDEAIHTEQGSAEGWISMQ
jgi:hypothetical protein